MKYVKPRLLIFDVDGTLYYLQVLRLIAGLESVISFLLRKTTGKEIKIFLEYRKFRDSRRSSLERLSKIDLDFCELNGIKLEYLQNVIKKFTHDKILKYIKLCQRPYVVSLVQSQMDKGLSICFLSDYPIAEKLECLNIYVPQEKCFSSADRSLDFLKPSAKGLMQLLENESYSREETILIGDSDELDLPIALQENIRFVKVGRRRIRKLRKELTSNDFSD